MKRSRYFNVTSDNTTSKKRKINDQTVTIGIGDVIYQQRIVDVTWKDLTSTSSIILDIKHLVSSNLAQIVLKFCHYPSKYKRIKRNDYIDLTKRGSSSKKCKHVIDKATNPAFINVTNFIKIYQDFELWKLNGMIGRYCLTTYKEGQMVLRNGVKKCDNAP